MIIIMLITFLGLMLLGMPIGFATAIASSLFIITSDNLPSILLPQRMFVAVDSFPLMAIPLFILAGELMNSGGITKKIVHLASALVGHITGGLAHITILASMIFAGMSGSSAAAAASVGGMMVPAMEKEGYDADFGAAVTACSAVIGPIIPPSIAMVMYGSITGYSIGKLFLGGFFPGIIMGLSLMFVAYLYSKKHHYMAKPKVSRIEAWVAFKDSIAALLMPIIIIGGILSGVFTATEAGVIGVVYGLIIGFLYKQIQIRDIPHIFLKAAVTTSTVMFIIGAAMLLGWILTSIQMPQMITATLLGISDNPLMIFFLILILLFVLGCFMIDAAIIPLVTPLFIPVIKQYGIDPIQFGIVMCMMTTTGGVTPPVGNLLYIACSISNASVAKVIKASVPFLVALLISILVCMLFPQITTFLPNLIMGK
ncbi:TRAP transporter large permease [Petroclostridium sp. X23]|uniref:TRAP transporter large permease n=1 Tax=Petroclostridium sp. X23 TaxID=3045146 RepID=UPI0024AD2FAB|nr:TRAP transporter large permease [Petroclostridium sp. X23]WHH57079.1 TRAP transporter large permease [Petroclostridium sp. X23]